MNDNDKNNMNADIQKQKKEYTILHILSQRPGRTGSGVTLDAIVRYASSSSSSSCCSWNQHAIVGTPSDDPHPTLGNLPHDRIHPLIFDTEELPLKLPGMSDVMPYPSSVFSKLTPEQIELYTSAWKRHITNVIEQVQPDIIYSHHIWLVSSMLKDIIIVNNKNKRIPIVTHCHATGLRQMVLCGEPLAQRVKDGCRRNDLFFTLHEEHKQQLQTTLDIEPDKIHTIGAGYRHEIFYAKEKTEIPDTQEEEDDNDKNVIHFVYAGKLSNAKGLPWLLDAFEQLLQTHSNVKLHIAGSGVGTEADYITQRIQQLHPAVIPHGMVSQEQLADLFRKSHIFILPSLYEGLPLVLVEAAACGCQLICTELTGVIQQLQPVLQDLLLTVPLPRLQNSDTPVPEDLPLFVQNLKSAMESAIQIKKQQHEEKQENDPTIDDNNKNPKVLLVSDIVKPFTWEGIFQHVEACWLQVLQNNNEQEE